MSRRWLPALVALVCAAGATCLLASRPGGAQGGAPPLQVVEVDRGSADRRLILDVVRAPVERRLGIKVVFMVARLATFGDWAYARLHPRTEAGNRIDYRRTQYAQDYHPDLDSDTIDVLLHRKGGAWTIVQEAFLPTDVVWEEWERRYTLPRKLFLAEQENAGSEKPQSPRGDPETSQRTTTIFNNGNRDAVQNQPLQETRFTVSQPTRITRITTYHWNDGRGTLAAGSIALRSGSGDLHGPWPAIGQPGQGGVRNAYWVVEPEIELPPGTYAVVDSDPATWAQNNASHGAGFAQIDGYPASGVATTKPDTAKTSAEAAAEPGGTKPATDSAPSETAGAAKPIFENWNTGSCETTDTATLTIARAAHLAAFELLYRWRADEKTVDYTVSFKGEKLGSGTLARGPCVAQQKDWCIARAEPGADLVPGSYTIQTPQPRICRNADSGGRGFIRAFGSRG